jgi:hypothetical protein
MRTQSPWRALVLLACFAGHPAFAQETDQARRLAELRADVERLAGEIDQTREDARGEIRSLELQKTDLEARIRSEEVRAQELQRLLEKQREVIQFDQAAGAALVPVLLDGLAKVKASIEAGLPYRVDDRLAEVTKLEQQLQAGTLTPQRASNRVWQLVEDELRLARENVMDKTNIVLEGKEMLVEVGRVGMLMMFFRTQDGRVGAVRGGPGAWRYEVLSGAAATQADAYIEALGKQIRVGYFDLPNVVLESR